MRQTLLTIFLIIAILATGLVWFWYIRVPAPVGPLGAPDAKSERLAQYRQLKNLKPDISILSDPLFQSLRQVAQPAPSLLKAVGRSNPFAPLQ